jgi:hypothetical protein
MESRRMVAASRDLDRVYQRIGEFVVSFQSLEHRIREIGWLLVDPHRAEWPPTQLRNLTNNDLLRRVQELYTGRVSTFPGVGSQGYCEGPMSRWIRPPWSVFTVTP